MAADTLCNASASGDLTTVQLLLQNGADVNGLNRYNRTALQVVKLGNPAVVQALLQAGADPNRPDQVLSLTVAHDAAREGFLDTMRALVEHGADVNLLDARGNLPLHLAARQGHLEVVQLLLGRTADPHAPNGAGCTARQLALHNGRPDVAKCIEEYLSSD